MCVSYYKQHSECIIVAKIDTKSTPTTVAEVYTPTISAADETEEMYDEIKEIIQIVKGEENFIVMGDWNTVVGRQREGKTVVA